MTITKTLLAIACVGALAAADQSGTTPGSDDTLGGSSSTSTTGTSTGSTGSSTSGRSSTGSTGSSMGGSSTGGMASGSSGTASSSGANASGSGTSSNGTASTGGMGSSTGSTASSGQGQQMQLDSLPSEVKSAVTKEASAQEISSIRSRSTAGKTIYDVEVRRAGRTETISFDQSGKRIEGATMGAGAQGAQSGAAKSQ